MKVYEASSSTGRGFLGYVIRITIPEFLCRQIHRYTDLADFTHNCTDRNNQIQAPSVRFIRRRRV